MGEFSAGRSASPGGEDVTTFIGPPGEKIVGRTVFIEVNEAEVRFGPKVFAKMKDYFGDNAHGEGTNGFEFLFRARSEGECVGLQNADGESDHHTVSGELLAVFQTHRCGPVLPVDGDGFR